MGTAVLKGYLNSGGNAADITVCGHNTETLAALSRETGINVSGSAAALAQECDTVLIAVKPKNAAEVLGEITDAFTEDKILVSIAAGWTIARLAEACPGAGKIVRVMPNTPLMAGEGMTALTGNENITAEDMHKVRGIFEGAGRAAEVPESLMDAVTGLSGSGPAFVYMFIEALADGGVLCGLPRAQAQEFAAQTVLGAAKMVLETGTHPGQLKDAVCSPAGTTIEGVRTLEQNGLRSAVIEAVKAACDKSAGM